jgi:hypothetical protein
MFTPGGEENLATVGPQYLDDIIPVPNAPAPAPGMIKDLQLYAGYVRPKNIALPCIVYLGRPA